MTRLLEKAIKRLKQLPGKEQNRFASIVLDEVTWQQLFEQSQKQLDKLGEEVLKEIKQGKFKKIGR